MSFFAPSFCQIINVLEAPAGSQPLRKAGWLYSFKMSKRQRKGLKEECKVTGGSDAPAAQPHNCEAQPDTQQPEPKRRSSRLSTKPVVPEEVKPEPKPEPKPKAKMSKTKLSLASRTKVKGESTPVPAPAATPAAPTKPAAVVGYTSDGASFDSVTDDDDMLPDIDMESPTKERKYVKDDIVWAPHRDVYWPAIVTSVKPPHVCYLFINETGEHVFKKHTRHLLPFDNPSRNLKLKELGEKEGLKFKNAYELVIKYLVKRKQNTNLNARRFLTLDENDKVAQAKTCLLRLTGSFDGFDNEEDKSDADEHVINSDDETNDPDKPCESNLHTEGRSPNERAKVEEILRDLETIPTNMTVTSEQCKEMEKEAHQLLEVIRSKDCFNYLMEIREGTIQSSRHMKHEKEELVHGGLGPFTLFQDLTNELLTVIDSHCDDYDSPSYKQSVMLPEAIFYAITKVRDCSKLDAKRHFHKTCSKVGVKD